MDCTDTTPNINKFTYKMRQIDYLEDFDENLLNSMRKKNRRKTKRSINEERAKNIKKKKTFSEKETKSKPDHIVNKQPKFQFFNDEWNSNENELNSE